MGTERFNRIAAERTSFIPKPSTAIGLAQGFAAITRFLSGSDAMCGNYGYSATADRYNCGCDKQLQRVKNLDGRA